METESNSIFWYKKLIYFKREDNMFKLMWSYPPSIDEIFWFFIPWFNNNRTVCARCSRTEACQMKRGWKPSKTNLRKPDSWLKKPTENTTRWPFIFFFIRKFTNMLFTNKCTNNLADINTLILSKTLMTSKQQFHLYIVCRPMRQICRAFPS